MKTFVRSIALATAILGLASTAVADQYRLDMDTGRHSFITAKFLHIGLSGLIATFKDFDGTFVYDAEDITNSSIELTVQVASIDSNHSERDNHMRGARFLNVDANPTATFVSTSVEAAEGDAFTVRGNLTLGGVTKPVSVAAHVIGKGNDPWGGVRTGVVGNLTIDTKDFGFTSFNPISTVELNVYLEGVQVQ